MPRNLHEHVLDSLGFVSATRRIGTRAYAHAGPPGRPRGIPRTRHVVGAVVLEASGNEMFRHVSGAVAEVLRGRTTLGLMPTHPHEAAMQQHMDVADAIHGGRPDAAREAMLGIMRRAYDELQASWT